MLPSKSKVFAAPEYGIMANSVEPEIKLLISFKPWPYKFLLKRSFLISAPIEKDQVSLDWQGQDWLVVGTKEFRTQAKTLDKIDCVISMQELKNGERYAVVSPKRGNHNGN